MDMTVLPKKLKILMVFRVAFASLLLGTYRIFDIGYYKQYTDWILYLIVSLYLLTIIYSLFINRVKNIRAFAYLQLTLDTTAGILLISLTGGIESWFSFVLLLTVIASAIIIDKKAGYVVATISSILYGLLIDLQFYRILPVAYTTDFEEKDFFYNIFSHISAFYLTALMTGYLSSRLEKTSISLEQSDSDLRDLTLFNRELIESLPTGLLTTDITGRILSFNKAAKEMTGINNSRIVSMNLRDLFPFTEITDKKERMEGTIINNNETRVIGLALTGITDNKGGKKGYICIFQDITRLKNLENELKLKETLAAIGEMSANMAHEMRNPLASLRGSVEMLKEGALNRGRNKKLLDIALSEMDRLNKIITDFLTYSRPRPPELARFNVVDLLAEITDSLKNVYEKRNNIVLRRNFGDKIIIMADPHKLRQVFLNLGVNAIESMKDGGELTIEARDYGDNIVISFQDTGEGISPENLQQIFYPFFTTKDKGTGLGLAIAYRIIEDHGGKINVRSRLGHGSAFEVVLPAETGSTSSNGYGRDHPGDKIKQKDNKIINYNSLALSAA